MLNGIEVLNKVELMDTIYNKIWENLASFFGYSLIVFLALTVIILFIDSHSCKNVDMIASISMFTLIASIALFIVSCVAIVFTSKQVPNGKYKYQVTISDNVSMVEFNERYDVISVEGKIYTIVEKER